MTTIFTCSTCGSSEALALASPSDIHSDAPPIDVIHQIRFGNLIPTEDQKDLWKLKMDEIQQQIQERRDIIARILDVLSPIEKEIGKLQEYWKTYDSLRSSPIRKLPQEILTEIFIIRCHSSYSLAIGTVLESEKKLFHPALDLSQVCSFWRNILQSTPSLWTSIYVNVPFAIKDTIYDLSKSLINLYLRRSQQRPLSLHLTDLDFSAPDMEIPIRLHFGERGYNLFLNHFVVNCYRLRHITLDVDPRILQAGGLGLIGNISFPVMESITFKEKLHAMPPPWLKGLERAPHLHTVRFEGELPVAYLGQSFPIPKVRTVIFGRLFLSPQLMEWLPKVDSLKCLEIRDLRELMGWDNNSQEQPVVLPDLERLLLSCTPNSIRRKVALPRILSSFTAPRLTSLDLSGTQPRRLSGLIWPHAEFLSLLKRSNCVLTDLALDCLQYRITVDRLLEIFQSTQNLERLSIRYGNGNCFLNDFCWRTVSLVSSTSVPEALDMNCSRILPRLAHLTLKSESPRTAPAFTTLVQFLETRRKQTGLRSFCFARSKSNELIPRFRKHMRALIEAGMDICLMEPSNDVKLWRF